MKDLSRLLTGERELERRVAAGAVSDRNEKGWTAALMFFHVARWRGRLLSALTDHVEGGSFAAPPGNIDEFNDAELPAGRSVSLEDAAAQSDAAFGSLIELWHRLGDRPFAWYVAETTSEALTRNSYLHPRIHLASYLLDRGDKNESDRLVEETAVQLRSAAANPRVLGAALYNLANVRVTQGRNDEAIALLEEAAPMRPDLSSYAIQDTAFAALRDSPRFRDLGKARDPGQPR
jgi:tetratricopeptide (TPR) repeat protein